MSTAVMSFGRFNPPHTGHKLVADTVKKVAKKEKGTPLVYLSHTQNQKKDPLTYEHKVKFAKAFFGNVVQKSKEIVVPGETDEEEAAANDFGWEIRVCVLAHESASTISMANPPRGSTLPTTSARTRTPGKPVRQ